MFDSSVHVRVTLLRVAPEDLARAAALLPWLPNHERARAAGMTRERRRGQFVAGRALLRWRFSQRLGRAPDAVPIICEPTGRPMLAMEGCGGISLAHTSGWVVMAEAPGSVGVDVESTTVDRPCELARTWFTPAEARAICAAPDAAACLRRFWVAKEAVLKALGTGLSVSLSAFEVPEGYGDEACGGSATSVKWMAPEGLEAARHVVQHIPVDTACEGAVAWPANAETRRVVVERMTLNELQVGLTDMAGPSVRKQTAGTEGLSLVGDK